MPAPLYADPMQRLGQAGAGGFAGAAPGAQQFNPVAGANRQGVFAKMLRGKLQNKMAERTMGGSGKTPPLGQGGSDFNIWDMGGDKYHGFDPFVNTTRM